MGSCSEQSSVDFETIIPRQQILVKDGWQNSHPVWRGDGARILYAARSTTRDSTLVREVEIAGKHIRTLFGVKGTLTFPAYASDSTEYYCIANRLGDHDLWSVKPALATWSRLSSEAGDESFIRPAPDGRHLAYLTSWRIALLDLQSRHVDYLKTPDHLVLSLSWDADGQELLFSGMETYEERLYRFRLDSAVVAPLAFIAPLGGWPVAARWNAGHTPGPYVAFEESGGLELYMPGEDRQATIVASGKMPAWSPDGTTLVYVRGNDLILDKIWVVINE